MSSFDQPDPLGEGEPETEEKEGAETEEKEGGLGHSRWMMIACCVPMLVIAVVVALNGAGLGFLVVAVMCTAMMALMMGGMSSGGGDSGSQDR